MKPKSKILIENIEEPLLIYIPKGDCNDKIPCGEKELCGEKVRSGEKVPCGEILPSSEIKPISEIECVCYTKTSKCKGSCGMDAGTYLGSPVCSNLYIPSAEMHAIDIRDANLLLNFNDNLYRNDKYGRNNFVYR